MIAVEDETLTREEFLKKYLHPENEKDDILGLETFELTESVYDLLVSLTNAYIRLCYKETQKSNPDEVKHEKWFNEARKYNRMSKTPELMNSFKKLRALRKELAPKLREIEALENKLFP